MPRSNPASGPGRADAHLAEAIRNNAAHWTSLAAARGHDVTATGDFVATTGDDRVGSRIVIQREGLDLAALATAPPVAVGCRPLTIEDPYGSLDASTQGFVPRRLPVMALEEMPRIGGHADGVTVTRVSTPSAWHQAERVAVETFDIHGGQLPPDEFWPVSLLANPDVGVFTAVIGATTVGTCMTIRTDGVVGLYWVATLPDYRSRGVARALMTAALGLHAGRLATLTASAMGEPLYTALGFRRVGTCTLWSA